MNLIVNKDWTLSFENENDETLNANDVLWHRLNVKFDAAIRPTHTESVLVVFQDDKEKPTNISKEELTFESKEGTWSALIPPEIVKMAQTWYLQILVRRYNTTDETKYVQKGTPFVGFMVENGALFPDGSPITSATVAELYAKTLENAKTAEDAIIEVQERRDSAVNDIEAVQVAAVMDIQDEEQKSLKAIQDEEEQSLKAIQEAEKALLSGVGADVEKSAIAARQSADDAERRAVAAHDAKNDAVKAAGEAESAAESARETMRSVGLLLRGTQGQPTFYLKDGRLFVRIIKGSVNPYRIENGRLKMTIVKEVL